MIMSTLHPIMPLGSDLEVEGLSRPENRYYINVFLRILVLRYVEDFTRLTEPRRTLVGSVRRP